MNGAPVITYDFLMGQLRVAMVAVLAYGGGKGWWTPQDAGLMTALAASLGPIALPWIWSIVSNLSVIHVASGSAAASVAKVESNHPVAAINAAIKVAAETGTKIAAAMLLGFILFSPFAANAQGKKTAPSPANPVQTFLNSINKKAEAINAFTLSDAQAAMTMAANDPVGLACYTAIANRIQNAGAGNIMPKSLGLLQLIETARLAKLQISAVQTGTDPVVQGCAGLILDANTTLLMLTGQGVVGAAALAIP